MDDLKRLAIERWLLLARHDLVTARTMLTVHPPLADVACFHCQQCAEKALKAFLVFADIHVEKTHFVRRRLDLCAGADPSFDRFQRIATDLTEYAVVGRYPDEWREFSVAEGTKAVRSAEEVLGFVRKRIPGIALE